MLKLHRQQQRRCPSWFKVNGRLLSHQNRLDPHINHVIVFPKWISKIGVTQSNPNVSISSVVLSLSLFFSLSIFLYFFVWSLLRGLLLANSMAEFSHYFQICSKNSVRKMVLVTGLYHCKELIKSMVCVCFFVSPCLVMYGASWGSTILVVSSSLCLSSAFTHCRELMKSVGKLWWLIPYHTYY
jgi:hypothetical protein